MIDLVISDKICLWYGFGNVHQDHLLYPPLVSITMSITICTHSVISSVIRGDFFPLVPPISVPNWKPPSSQSRPFLVTGFSGRAAVINGLEILFLVLTLGGTSSVFRNSQLFHLHPKSFQPATSFDFLIGLFSFSWMLPFFTLKLFCGHKIESSEGRNVKG